MPEVFIGDDFYLRAFYELSTCRHISESLGVIPWRDIYTYTVFAKLEDDLIDPFIQVIRALDNAYLKWYVEHPPKPPGPTPPKKR